MSMLQEVESISDDATQQSALQIIPGPAANQNDSVVVFSAKRAFDVLGASAALVFFLPLMAIIYCILLFRGGMPIFAHPRVGKDGVLFPCYKFRSMVRDADKVLAEHLACNPGAAEEWRQRFKLEDDPRITPFGSFLRRASLDELPQLVNVLKGDMSLVGPRPVVPAEIQYYSSRAIYYYQCRPGLTGLWQVSGRNLVSYDRRVRLDVVYAKRQSLRLDIVILMRTIWVVLRRHGAC